MNGIIKFIKKEPMPAVSVIAAIISLFVTPPSMELVHSIDWKTLAILFMLLSVLDGFKKENLFLPLIKLASGFGSVKKLTYFFVFSVFFSSMFVTNDVSLIIFVPLTMLMFKEGKKEKYIIPVLVLENIAAVRGSLLTPFGSPQNLFLYEKSGIAAVDFMLMMLPLWLGSMVILWCFIAFMYRREPAETIVCSGMAEEWKPEGKARRIVYLCLFVLIVATILSRTSLWPYVLIAVVVMLLVFDRRVFLRVDYLLLLTFFCFFVFSSSITANEKVASFLGRVVSGREYIVSILISQVISNVPASIVLWPFTSDLRALLYGLDSAGLVTVIGSLASVINMRLYGREYPGNGAQFMKWFEIISLAFFAIVFVPQLLICRMI